MGVPAHDARDFQFAKQNDLPIRVVIVPEGRETPEELAEAYTEPGRMVNSGDFDGIPSVEGKQRLTEYAEKKGFGKARVQYRLRDWLVSRQRYWGVPIPIVHCPNCGAVPVPDEDLPVLLPEDVAFSGRGASPLSQLEDWKTLPVRTVALQRSGKRTRWTRLWTLPGTSYAIRTPTTKSDRLQRPRRTTGCLWISTWAVSSTQFCICCTRAFLRRCCAIAVW